MPSFGKKVQKFLPEFRRRHAPKIALYLNKKKTAYAAFVFISDFLILAILAPMPLRK